MLTIFTPTYNRAGLLKRLYESLVKQSIKDFVWLIVDDGSVDDTKELISNYINQGLLNIRYYYQQNGGKMRAHNQGVLLCDTELFMCVDSDDYITDDAVEKIYATWADKKNRISGRKEIGGIVAHKGQSTTKLLGDTDFPKDMEYATLQSLYLNGFRGETTLVFLAEVLKKYLFPEFEGEKYVPEDVVYDKIDSEYDLIVLPQIITVCEIVSQGYTDQAAKLRKDNPRGWHIYYEQRMVSTPLSVLKIKYISHYIIFSHILKKNPFKEKKIGLHYILIGYLGAAILKILGKT